MSASEKMMKATLEHIAAYSSEPLTRKLCIDTLRNCALADQEERKAFEERAAAAFPALLAGCR